MAGRRKEIKSCVVCGKKITGFKDYCAICHRKILEDMNSKKRGGRGKRIQAKSTADTGDSVQAQRK